MALLFLFILFVEVAFTQHNLPIKPYQSVTHGSARMDQLLPQLKNKKVGIITNPSGMVGKSTIVDTLLALGVEVVKIFGPEHGFRGDTEAGEKITNGIDPRTQLPVISLYGKNKKPTVEQLQGIEIMVFDIQDVGVRFYTYISTMTYAMEACADAGIPFVVCDRPNPNGFYVDGPVLEKKYKSFLGLHAVPVVYGLTIGEYAKMLIGEKWLQSLKPCTLTVIPLLNYDRNASYELPVAPSPNLRDVEAILLYPSLGLFEGTIMSLGRGTPHPFKVIGHPNFSDTNYFFIPKPSEISNNPRYNMQKCYGLNFTASKYLQNHPKKIEIKWIIKAYQLTPTRPFFEATFNQHSGNDSLQSQIKCGVSEQAIRKSWEKALKKFLIIRKKYLIYPDFL